MTTEDIENWMREERIKRVIRMAEETGGGWCVYPIDESTFGTGATLQEAVNDARGRA